MKKTLATLFTIGCAAFSLLAQNATIITGTMTLTTIPTLQVAPLIQTAIIPRGTISVDKASGNLIVRGSVIIILPPSEITNLATVPEGYDPTNFNAGSFKLNGTNGTITVTANWNAPTNSP